MKSEINSRVYYRFSGAVSKIISALREQDFVVSDVHDSRMDQRYDVFNNKDKQIGELKIDKEFRWFIPRDSQREIIVFRGEYQSSKLDKFSRKYRSKK